jgi:hypothetical protein
VLINSQGQSTLSAEKDISLVDTASAAVNVYPNPWRVDKSRNLPITFDGVHDGSTVKLFTLAGFWIKTLHASSTSITWDLRNDNGEPVASGLYLYLIESSDGHKTARGKLAIIR